MISSALRPTPIPDPLYAADRDYYTAIGYTTPYRWAHYVDAPFQPLKKAAGAIARHHRHHRRPL